VGGERWEAGSNLPGVKVVHVLHAEHFPANLVGVYTARDLLQQYVRRVPEELTGDPQNREADQDADDRVRVESANQQDDEGGGDHAHRA
jgi:hypothetical protein